MSPQEKGRGEDYLKIKVKLAVLIAGARRGERKRETIALNMTM